MAAGEKIKRRGRKKEKNFIKNGVGKPYRRLVLGYKLPPAVYMMIEIYNIYLCNVMDSNPARSASGVDLKH